MGTMPTEHGRSESSGIDCTALSIRWSIARPVLPASPLANWHRIDALTAIINNNLVRSFRNY